MIFDGLQFFAQRVDYNLAVQFYARDRKNNLYDLQCSAEPYEEGQAITTPPLVTLSVDNTQSLFEELWRLGFRPSQAQDEYKGELKATKYHLEDMRKLAKVLEN